MGKLLKPLLVVAAIAVNVIPGVGQVLSAAIITSITAAGISAALGMAASALGLGPKSPSISEATRGRLYANVDPSCPRKLVFGRTAMATDIRYQEWQGANQEYFHQIVCAASHKVTSFTQVWLDDKLAWSNGAAQGEFVGYLTITPVLEGGPGNTVTIGSGSKWGASRRMTGLAYLHMRFKVTGNGKKKESPFAQSIPSRMTIVGDGMPVYDPRFDSTRGGSGPMRTDDETTWAFTYGGVECGRNPANQLGTYLLGWRITNPANGTKKLAVGRGIPADRFDFAKWITAANACDETVALAVGGTEPRYRSDAIFSEADDPRQVIETFEVTMNAKLRDTGGRFGLVVISNDLATPRLALDDNDVLGEFRWNPKGSIERSFNEIRGRFTDPRPGSLYQLVDYPRYREPPIDGIERVLPFDLPAVQSPSQAQRLVKQQFARLKYQGRFEASIGARGWALQLGDIVTLTFSSLGWGEKLFRVVEHGVRPDGVCPLVLQEENADIYLWDADERPAVEPVEPVEYDASKSVLLQLLVADELEYVDGTPIEDLKPAEAGADVTGLHTSANTHMVDTRTAQQVNADLDAQATAIDDLLATYGETASAEASATAAAAARDAAQTAQALSEQAFADADTRADAAQTSATNAAASATAAGDSATASAGSASAASTSATAAGTSASAAQADRIAAQTARGGAETAQTAAAASESTAAGHASAAATSATVSASFNGGALNRNPNFDQGNVGWFGSHQEDTGTVSGTLLASANGRSNVWSGEGYFTGYSQFIPIAAGQKIELSAGYYVSGAAAAEGAIFYLGIVPYDAAKVSLTGGGAEYFLRAGHQSAGGWHDVSAILDVGASYPNARYVRVIMLSNYAYSGNPAPAGTTQWDYIRLENVTQREAAAGSASAAAVSASTASVAATDAGTSATSATTQANTATTKAGEASVSAGQAATSASGAAGSASAAHASEQLSASHAGAASTSATNASTSSASASASEAAATASAMLSASVNTGSINPNPNFIAWPAAQALPTSWDVWEANGVTKLTNADAQHPVVEMASATGQDVGLVQFETLPGLNRAADGYYVLELDAQAWSGASWQGTLLLVYFFDQAGTYIGAQEINAATDTLPDGTLALFNYQYIHKWRKLAQAPAGSRSARVYLLHNWFTGVGDGGTARTVRYYRAAIRAASPAEIRDQTVLPGLQATVSTQGIAIADLDTAVGSLTTTVSTQGVTVTEHAQAITAIEGNVVTLFGRAGVLVDVNGRITGWETNNNGQAGDFVIHSDYFSIEKPGGGARTEFSDGNWRVYDSNGILRSRWGVWT